MCVQLRGEVLWCVPRSFVPPGAVTDGCVSCCRGKSGLHRDTGSDVDMGRGVAV